MSLLQNTTCLICHTNSNMTITLPCGCNQTCIDCLGQWVLSKISPTQPDGLDQKITCPLDSCRKGFTISQIYSKMPESEKARINEALLKTYLNKAPNIQKCPKQGCDYALVVDIPCCSQELKCALCQTEWRTRSESYTSHEETGFFKKFFHRLRNAKNEIFTSFWKFFKSKKCPGCKVPISKEPFGCKMLTCSQCQFQFCWYCLKDGQSCSHGDQEEAYGEPGPGFGVYFNIGFIFFLYFGGLLGAFWITKTVGCWIISLFV